MAYVPGLETDVFISYAHRNNVDGWVTALDSYLSTRVPEFLEHDANVTIWRDKSLSGFDLLWPTLQEKVENSALFLSICSPVYVTSENCEKEVNHFLERGFDIPRLERRSRMAWAVIIPYEGTRDQRPSFNRSDTVRYSFFTNRGDDTFAQYEVGSPEFKKEADRLAQHIAVQLRRVREELERRNTPSAFRQSKTIFIANCSRDRRSDRETVINEFKNCELLFVPDGTYSEKDLSAQTLGMLAQADCSVHILGETAGITPDDSEEPIVRLQYRLALAHRRPGFTQIAWTPDSLQLVHGGQKEFVEKVRSFSPEVWATGTEVLRGGRDDLLRGIAGILQRSPSAAHIDAAGPLYLLCSKADFDSADENLAKLRDNLCLAGILPEFPAFDDQDVDLANIEKNIIKQSCATVIYYGKGGDGWVKLKRQTLIQVLAELKAQKQTGDLDHYVRALYLSEPINPPKQTQYLGMKVREFPEARGYSPLLVLGTASAFQSDHLKPLLDRIASENPGAQSV